MVFYTCHDFKFLECILLSELRQSQNVTYCLSPFIYHETVEWRAHWPLQRLVWWGWGHCKGEHRGLCGVRIALCPGHSGCDTHIHLRDRHSTAGTVTAFSSKDQPHSHCSADTECPVN